jgi:hypothetical protein
MCVDEHLPECWATDPSDPAAWCICDELRACEARVTIAAVQRVEALEYISTIGVTLSSVVPKATVIALIKGEQP